MFSSKKIHEMEKALERSNIPLADFLTDAGIVMTTWWRWKKGHNAPNMTNWTKVVSAFEKKTKADKGATDQPEAQPT